MNETDFYREAMTQAFHIAQESNDPSTQNAALLFDDEWNLATWAVNAFPQGVAEAQARWERPIKYHFVEHAERNAIYEAARLGVGTKGLTMVAIWASCADCARAIIQAGVSTLIRYEVPTSLHWESSTASGYEMLKEAGVAVITISMPLPNAVPIRFGGELWSAD